MKSSQMLIGSGLLLAIPILGLSLLSLQVSSQSAEPASPSYQLLANPSLEAYDPPYAQFEGIDCQVATGWTAFFYDGPSPSWMDSRVFASSHLGTGHVEYIDPETSQLVISTEPYTAGIQQQVTGLTPGLGYGFHAAMLTIYQTSAPPAVHGTMIKQVGVDPSGGTDASAPTVVWSEPDDHDEGPWDVARIVAAYAQAPTMTVFIRVISPLPSGGLPLLNYSILDSSIFAQTATVSASSPPTSAELAFTVRWDNAVASPGGEIRWYDVQWLDQAEGIWHQWFTWTDRLQAQFTGERGHTYHFRARAWQRYPNGAHLFSPYQPDGDTQTHILDPKLAGWVLGSDGRPVTGAAVAISGTAHSTGTGAEGEFSIRFLPLPGSQTITVSHPWLPGPAPVYGVTFDPTDTVTLTWTLRPRDDSLLNGGFEAGLEGWAPLVDQGLAPEVVDAPVHTGRHALALGGPAHPSSTVGVSQTASLASGWEPVLSFWYHPVTTDPDDRLNVVLTVVTQTLGASPPAATAWVFTPTLDLREWQHMWIAAGPPDTALTGTVIIRFHLWNDGDGETTMVYLDEVSLGSRPGGPHRAYLPLILH